jgi:hypothetical protein
MLLAGWKLGKQRHTPTMAPAIVQWPPWSPAPGAAVGWWEARCILLYKIIGWDNVSNMNHQ